MTVDHVTIAFRHVDDRCVYPIQRLLINVLICQCKLTISSVLQASAMTTKADAANYLEILEADAIRTKKLQTYNTALGYWSFLLSVILAFSLPSPIRVLTGQWSLSFVACISALSGHMILLVAIACCIRCCLVQAEELWDKYKMVRFSTQ